MQILQNHKDKLGALFKHKPAHQWNNVLLTPKHARFKDIADFFPKIRFFPCYVV